MRGPGGLARAFLAIALFVPALRSGAYTFESDGGSAKSVLAPGGFAMDLEFTGTTPDGVAFNDVAEEALAEWNFYLLSSFFTVRRAYDGTYAEGNVQNEVAFASTYYGTSFDSAIAITGVRSRMGRTVEADVFFDSSRLWGSYSGDLQRNAAGTRVFDLRRVALHEFGHVLGLGHPDKRGQAVSAVMISFVSHRWRLQQDDVEGGQFLYGSKSPFPVHTLSTTGANGTVTRSPDQGAYARDSAVTLTARPAAGFAFSRWRRNGQPVDARDNPQTFTVTEDSEVAADFVPRPTPTPAATASPAPSTLGGAGASAAATPAGVPPPPAPIEFGPRASSFEAAVAAINRRIVRLKFNLRARDLTPPSAHRIRQEIRRLVTKKQALILAFHQ